MKHLIALLIWLVSTTCVVGQPGSFALDQLIEVNGEWESMTNVVLPDLHFNSLSENEKIQLHLQLVEEHLRTKPLAHLSEIQKQRRRACLNVLNEYWRRGVFPINIYHRSRTPYFIDHVGTHCAVGHLIAASGHGDISMQIQASNNYGYVRELVLDHPELTEWAKYYGFTLQELAWIQPGYPICESDCDEYVFVSVSSSADYVGELTYYWPELNLYTNYPTELCPGESYLLEVTDEEGTVIPDSQISYFTGSFIGDIQPLDGMVFIQESAEPETTFSMTESTHYCDGSASFEVLNDVMVSDIHWLDFPGNETSELTGLCPGWYHVNIQTDYECQTIDSVFVKPNYDLCPGDLNFDWYSNSNDLTVFLTHFGCLEYCEADLNGDDKTSSSDLTIFLSRFGEECFPE